MPYKIRKTRSGWVRVKASTGEVVSHHKTKAKALAAVRAVYANERRKQH